MGIRSLVYRHLKESVVIRSSQGCMVWLGTLAWLLTAVAPAYAKIEAVKGKKYKLTKAHGPHMIMVTSLKGTTTEEHRAAEEAANELVYELRLKGIPAYVYKRGAIVDRIESVDRRGQASRKIVAQQRPEIAVLAGNYDEIDEETRTGKIANTTLAFIKRFRPVVLKKHAELLDAAAEQINDKFDGAGFKGKQQYGPLYKAFIATNPLLTPQEVAARHKNPLLQKLNLGQENSIAENPGQYTLVVATFEGKSTIKPTRATELDNVIKEGTSQFMKQASSLDDAAYLAWLLAKTMRSQTGKPAYVFHDRFRSVVTVGAFNSPDDPAIKELTDKFKAKYKRDQNTKREVLVAECFKIMGDANTPDKVWVMDPQPQLVPVPRLR